MKRNNKVSYKRYRNKVEIIGEGKAVKALIWFDQIGHKMIYLLIIIILLFGDNKCGEFLGKWLSQVIGFFIITVIFIFIPLFELYNSNRIISVGSWP